MESMRSIHVPAPLVRKVTRVLGYLAIWALPSAATVWSIASFGLHWVGDIATKSWVGDTIADVSTTARAAQSEGFSREQRLRAVERQAEEAFRAVVRLRAELEVHRRFPRSDVKTLGDLIDDAQRYYVRYYDAELRARKRPDEAASKTFELYRWRPPK